MPDLISREAMLSKIDPDKYYHSNEVRDIANNLPIVDAMPAMERLGYFGALFQDYKGCPRGAVGRACVPLEEEVLLMPELKDVDGGRWIPVNADALHELTARYVRLRDHQLLPHHCPSCGAKMDLEE